MIYYLYFMTLFIVFIVLKVLYCTVLYSAGHEVVDGGFQLFVTDPEGVEVPDPVTGEPKHYPFQTNLVYAWLRIHVREEGDDCGMDTPPPEWIVIRYQVQKRDI